jgi:phospholipase D1/2
MDTRELGLTQLSQLPALPLADDTDIGGPPLARTFSGASSHVIHPLLSQMRRPVVTEDCMRDPLCDAFYLDTWHTIAENNTKLFRQVFRCQPDNEVKTWKEYKEYAGFGERFSQSQGGGKSQMRKQQETPGKTGPPGTATVGEKMAAFAGNTSKSVGIAADKLTEKMGFEDINHRPQSNEMGNVGEWAEDQEKSAQAKSPTGELNGKASLGVEPADDAIVSPISGKLPTEWEKFPSAAPNLPDTDQRQFNPSPDSNSNSARHRTVTITEPANHPSMDRARNQTFSTNAGGSRKGRRRGTTKSSTRAFHADDDDSMLNKADARQLLELVQGHLVVWPYDWLEHEVSARFCVA